MRVVVDTNVLVSGLITERGTARRLVNALVAGRFEPILTPAMAIELLFVVGRPKFRAYVVDQRRLSAIASVVDVFAVTPDVAMPSRDSGDQIVVEAAVAGRADVIVTGDRDLLDDMDLRAWLLARGVEIITAAELMRRLDSSRSSARRPRGPGSRRRRGARRRASRSAFLAPPPT